MEVIIERACGMDVHKDSIIACIMIPKGKVIQKFSNKTIFLFQLIDWIKEHGCTNVARKVQFGSLLLTYWKWRVLSF